MPTRQALSLAIEKGLDLVDIAPQATPHVCRIMDYNKFRYEQAKREKEARKNQKTVDIKEVRMSMNIDTHDFETKANQAARKLASLISLRKWKAEAWPCLFRPNPPSNGGGPRIV